MSWFIKRGLLLVVFAYAPLSKADGLCTDDEKPLFSCRIEEKLLSICASSDAGHESGYVQYRFGTPRQLELEFPAMKRAPAGQFAVSSIAYSGGGETRVRFKNSEVTYYVYEKTIRSDPSYISETDFDTGIIVASTSEKMIQMHCSRDSTNGFAQESYAVFEAENWSKIPQ